MEAECCIDKPAIEAPQRTVEELPFKVEHIGQDGLRGVEHAIVKNHPVVLHKRELGKGSVEHEYRCCNRAGRRNR